MAKPISVAILISGSGSNLQAIIDAQLAINIVAVISDNPDAYGLTRAKQAGLSAISLDYQTFSDKKQYNQALFNTLRELNPDLVVLSGYMRIVPDEIVDFFNGKMINIHPSLLPKHPGLHTYEKALQQGDTQHGTSIHFVTNVLDGGPLIAQQRLDILPTDTVDSLKARTQQLEHQLFPQVIEWFAQHRLRLENNQVLFDGKPLQLLGFRD